MGYPHYVLYTLSFLSCGWLLIRYTLPMSSSPIIGMLTVEFSAGTRSSCVQQNHCTSRMRSKPQLRNDKYIDTINQLDKLNSFPAIAFELFSSMARALGL